MEDSEDEASAALEAKVIQLQDHLSSYDPILQELADLRQSGLTSGVMVSSIKKAILSEVPSLIETALKRELEKARVEQSALLAALEKKHTDAMQAITTTLTQTQQVLTDLETAKESTERSIQDVGGLMDAVKVEIGRLKKELRMKAEAVDLSEVTAQLQTYTPLRQTDRIEAALKHYPTIEDLSKVSDRVADLSTALMDCPTARDVRDVWQNCKSAVHQATHDLVTQETFLKLQANLDVKTGNIATGLEGLKSTLEKQAANVTAAFHSMQVHLGQKPWMPDIDSVAVALERRATLADLKQLGENLQRFVNAQNQTALETQTILEQFESALGRFDEVILLKASREDVKALSLQVQDPAPFSSLSKRLQDLESRFAECESNLTQSVNLTKTLSSQLSEISQSKRSDDFSVLKDTVAEMKYILSMKVDQADANQLKEQKSDREDVNVLHTSLKLHHKQMEQAIVLLTATLRTLLKDSEPRHQKQQQREYLLKHAVTLGNWVAGFDTGAYHEPLERKDVWSPADPVKGGFSSRDRSPKEHPTLPLLATSRMKAKHTRVQSQNTYTDGKWPFELPKIHQDVE